MKTDALIELLARGAGPAPRAVAARRWVPVAALGLAVSALLALSLIGPIPAPMFSTPVPWIKLAYAGAFAAAAGWLTARLARPIAHVGAPRGALLTVLGAMGLAGLLAWLATPGNERMLALLGQSWLSCPWNVLAFSLPTLAGSLWAVRGLAPTRPRAAGFAAGLFAGAVGAFGYALSCPEQSAAFVAVWYTLGIGLTGALGALLGPRVLRW
jgi:hypothetical protein